MLNIIHSFLDIVLKTNPFLKFAVITGCLRIAKESIFTGTNNFVSYSIADTTFRDWYNGYRFGDSAVYCP